MSEDGGYEKKYRQKKRNDTRSCMLYCPLKLKSDFGRNPNRNLYDRRKNRCGTRFSIP